MTITVNRRARPPGSLMPWLALGLTCLAGRAAEIELRPVATETNGVVTLEYRSGNTLVWRSSASAPAGVELRLPDLAVAPVLFRSRTMQDHVIELGPTEVGALTLRLRLEQKTPSLVQRTLEVRAGAAQRFSVTFPLDAALEGEFASFSGPEKARTLYDTVRGSAKVETFPVVMLRTSGSVFGLVADSPGLWENRCQVLLDRPARRLAVLTGDGRAPYPLIIQPPEDARDTYQYQMDGWQSLAAGDTRRFTTWAFASPARTHYDAQVAAHLAVANGKGWKTYHDVLPYDDDDSPASNQGFHCGALLAAQELGLQTTEQEIERAMAAYRSLFNAERGFMPTSRKQRDILGQDTLYGATLTYAVFGRKSLTDEQVLTHYRTSERVKTPYGLRVISQADGSLLPGHTGVYCYGGSWFLNDAANYLLAGVHGLPVAEVDALLIERIAREIAHVPAFNESISTVDGKPHGHVLYSWNSGYWWLRREIRRRLGQTDADPVDAAIDARLNVVRKGGVLRLEPSDPW